MEKTLLSMIFLAKVTICILYVCFIYCFKFCGRKDSNFMQQGHIKLIKSVRKGFYIVFTEISYSTAVFSIRRNVS